VALWNRIFCAQFLKGRTVVLVTQQGWLSTEADLAIEMENGRLKSAKVNTNKARRPRSVTQSEAVEKEKNRLVESGGINSGEDPHQ